jgi:hypothetical protein
MTGAADVVAYAPGERVPVEVVADSGGAVATRGQGVALAGENDDYTEVTLTESAGTGVGVLSRDADDFTGSQGDYAAGDSAGTSTAMLYKPVAVGDPADDWDPAATGTQTPSVGDETEFAAGGVLQTYAGNADSPYGVVFRTVADDFTRAGKILVAVYR